MGRFVHKRLEDSRGPHSMVVDNRVSLALRKSMPPTLETDAGSCSGTWGMWEAMSCDIDNWID